MIFTWDRTQEQTNIRMHGINFKVASRVLLDPDCKIVLDEVHSIGEIRYHCYERSGSHFLLVNFTVLDEDLEVIRIIDAWEV